LKERDYCLQRSQDPDPGEAMNSKTDQIMEREREFIRGNIKPGYEININKKYHKLVKWYLEANETMILVTRQSHLEAITPLIVVATDKKLIILQPSFFGLHLGFNILTASDASFIPYNIIKNITFSHGRYLSSITIKAPGLGEVVVHGLKTNEAKKMLNFLEKIVEASD
jgi:hypothetical protein